MFVVVEGLDRSGKTTLAMKLAHETGHQYSHWGKPTMDPLDEYLTPLQDSRPLDVIADRYHWGERVWPEVFGRETTFDWAKFRYVEMVMQAKGAVMVSAVRDLREIEQACLRDGEPMQGEQIRQAADLFGLCRQMTILPVHRWQFGQDPARICSEAALRARRAARLSAITPRWIGCQNPDLLLVGDAQGPLQTDWDLPFVPYSRTSGHFLMEELTRMGMQTSSPPSVAIVNAFHKRGELDGVDLLDAEPVADLWEQLDEPALVPLGRNAERQLKRIGLTDWRPVQHPQYVRRFRRAQGPGWYARQILEAMR